MILTTLFTIGAAQGFILAIALWHRKINRASNRLLAVWLLFLTIDLVIKTLYLADDEKSYFATLTITHFFPLLYGSFFYLYVRSISTQKLVSAKDLVHFIAFIVYVGINLPVIIGFTPANPIGLQYFDFILFPYSITYVISGFLLVLKYQKNLRQQSVDIEDIDLNWLIYMSYAQAAIWLIALSQLLLAIKGYDVWTIYAAISVWMILMGYLSLSQQNIPALRVIKTPPAQNVDDNRFDEVKQSLIALIENEKIHLQPSLTIGNLAKSSGYPEYLISLFINRVYGMNFRDYINELRITEAKSMLCNNHNKRSILDIAYACGYNSKSTFNSSFKKHTGLTPSQFKQSQL